MSRLKSAAIFILVISAALHAGAQTLTASCHDPKGRALGVLGDTGSRKSVDFEEVMTESLVTITWKTGSTTATVVTDPGGGKAVRSTEGLLVFASDQQMSVVVRTAGTVLLYSVYSSPRQLLISSHERFSGDESSGTLSKMFIAPCEVRVQ